MARYTGAVCKQCRREGKKLFLKGDRCYTNKCGFERRSYAPGQHGQGRKKNSEYGKQLIEKQKLRQMYGVNERQFRRLFMLALASKEVTGVAFMKLLESRLDNLVYRMGFARTRRGARQLVNHGHIEVNGKKLDIPSALLNVGDVVSVKESSKDLKVIKESLETLGTKVGWVEVDAEKLCGKYIREVERKELPQDITESQIVEYYNRKL